VELTVVQRELVVVTGVDEEPEADVGVSGVDANGSGDGDEDWPLVETAVVGGDAEFLVRFAAGQS